MAGAAAFGNGFDAAGIRESILISAKHEDKAPSDVFARKPWKTAL